MAKRFTDTDKYKKPFVRTLKGPYKLLWDYLYHDCNHAGIWIVDFVVAQIYLGEDMPINKEDALKYFNSNEEKVIEFDNGEKWFIPSFIEFQYGKLNEENRAHASVINILSKYGFFNKGIISPLQRAKDKDKDMDKVKDKDKDKKKYGEYSHVLLTNLQHEKLVADFGRKKAEQLIKRLDEYIQMKGTKYKDHNLVMRSWERKDSESSVDKPMREL